MGLEKLADQEFDAGDVPPHLEDRAVLLCVGKIKRVHRSRTDMLLPNYTCANEKRQRGRNDDKKNKNKSMSENRLEISSLFTCVYVGLAEEQRQTLYSFK